MDMRFVLDTLNAIRLELYRYRVVAALVFMFVTAGVLVVGYVTPKTYTSEALLYADQSDILQPLLRGSAEITSVDRINEAREMLQSRSYLEAVARKNGLLTGAEDDETKSGVIDRLRNRLNMRVSNRSFLEMTYTSDNPDKSFRTLSSALDEFVERTARKKRSESQNAFEFIDAQVKSYQRQLETAENNLKEFRANNQDGSSSNVQSRIERLRADIESLKLEIQQSESDVSLTRRQLEGEEPYRSFSVSEGRSETEERRAQLESRLTELRTRYRDNHPDVRRVLAQLEELDERAASNSGQPERRSGGVNEYVENPVYEELRLKLADRETQLQGQRNRLDSLQRLLEEAFDRSERVAGNEAELSELTRDYDVTKNVYEDMLQRRERARLSMTLDVQGQGVNYRIQEPASYPTKWDGLQLYQVGVAGPFLGSTMVLGLLGALVLFDQRIRSARTIRNELDDEVPVLGTIPHYNASWKERLLRKDILIIGFVLALFMTVYLSVLVFSIMGVQPMQLVNLVTGGGE